MMRPIVALATSERWPNLAPDDLPLASELNAAGIDAVPAVWTDPDVDWALFDAVIIRSTWDYHRRRDDFARWTGELPVPLFNPPAVVRWNMHKGYLLELGKNGVLIPRTEMIQTPRPPSWNGPLIVKPAVSASAYETHHFDDASSAASDIERLLAHGDVIVQEFVPEVLQNGEWSVVFLDGALSHTVRKLPKAGDFRVQEELGGSTTAERAPSRVVDAAAAILDTAGADVLYARVDVVERPAGVTLMELELIEPVLFFGKAPESARMLARALRRRLA
jgi:glutathione synthase/RimK-type ligase-like ATP-grasp enzyme